MVVLFSSPKGVAHTVIILVVTCYSICLLHSTASFDCGVGQAALGLGVIWGKVPEFIEKGDGSSHCGSVVMNLTNVEDADTVPGHSQWVKDSALP